MTTGLGIAIAVGFAVTAGAQPPTTTTPTTTTSPQQQTTTTSHSDKDHEITVTGCLARAGDGTFMLNNAHMANSMDKPTASTTTTGAATTTGTTGSSAVGTTAAEPSTPTTTDRAGAMSKGSAMSWKLQGGSDLERHVGHTIQVTGRTEWNEHSATTSSSSATTTTSSSGARLDVSSIKMVSSSCQ
jgi:hypothetical protein